MWIVIAAAAMDARGAATEDGGGERKEEVAASTPSLAKASHTLLLRPTQEFAIFMTVSRWFFYPTRLPLVSSSTLPAQPSRALVQPNRVPSSRPGLKIV
jgi:hypothetical protein